MSKLEEVKKKIDDKISEKPDSKSELKEPEEEEKMNVWTPFAKKIYTDIKLYKAKLGDAQPTRAVATKFRTDIEDKLEAGKEKDNLVKYFNKEFKLPGVSTQPYNYFSENTSLPSNQKTIDYLKNNTREKLLKDIKHNYISAGFFKNASEEEITKDVNSVLDFLFKIHKIQETVIDPMAGEKKENITKSINNLISVGKKAYAFSPQLDKVLYKSSFGTITVGDLLALKSDKKESYVNERKK